MNRDVSTSRRGVAPTIFRLLASFPVACFACALATDLAYAQTANVMWADFSAWLLAVGLGFGVLAAVAGLVALAVHRRDRARPSSWPLVVGGLVMLVVALLDNLVHSRDAWTSVMPEGLILSAVLAIVTLATVWIGFTRSDRRELSAQFSGARL